jgi:4-amino-4-deoxy-L-arabinose transferase-like glycosyltransferase
MIAQLRKLPPAVLLIVVFALAVLPNLTVRSFVWEEGRIAELARDITLRGDLLEPAIYGERYAEKPSLLSWIIAGVGYATGELNEWSARLPTMVAVLVTALLVLQLTRRFASEAAALFAAGCFVFCPLVLRKLTIAEPDTLITALIFGALVIWWWSRKRRIVRCLVCGALLALAAMTKGPQPLAYFALGIGGHLVVRKRWSEAADLILTLSIPAAAVVAWAVAVYRPGDPAVWLGYMRLTPRLDAAVYLIERARFGGTMLLDLLPGILLVTYFWNQRETLDREKRELHELLFWFAGAATLVLFFWPGANTRYAMPAAPAVAVMAGLGFDYLWQRRRVLVRAAMIMLGGLIAYQLALVWIVMPMFAERFGASRTAGLAIARAVGPSTSVFNVDGPDCNQLFYVSRPIRLVRRDEALQLQPPAWLVLAPAKLEWIKAHQPRYSLGQSVQTTSGQSLIAIEIGPVTVPE